MEFDKILRYMGYSIIALGIIVIVLIIMDIAIFNFKLLNEIFIREIIIMLMSIFLAAVVAIGIYKFQFADDSDRMIKKELMLIKAALFEIEELIRNTFENIDANSNNKIIKSMLSNKYSYAQILVNLSQHFNNNNLHEEAHCELVSNTYFFSSLENYLHQGRNLNENILYHIVRIRKLADIINYFKPNSQWKVIKWTIELDIHIIGLIKAIEQLYFVPKGLNWNDYERIQLLKKDFWGNKKIIAEYDKGMADVIKKIEGYSKK